MSTIPNTVKPETLIAHSSFVRNMARNLLRDENRADDIEQETWLAALKSPPDIKRPLRSWLMTVMKNFSRIAYRDEERRRKRERCAATTELVRSTDELVEQEAMRRYVVKALLSLKEPYKSALLFRFYDNLPPRKIAKMLNTPVETVKTRIQRGLHQLRRRLDSEFGGDRNAWRHAIAPLTCLKLATTASISFTTVLSGVTVMSTKLKVISAAVVGIGLALVTWQGANHLLDDNKDSSLPYSINEISKVENGSDAETLNANAAGLNIRPEPGVKALLLPEGPCISGQVVNKVTGEPIEAFFIYIHLKKIDIQETVYDNEGRFHFPIKHGGVGSLTISSSTHLPESIFNLEVADDTGLTDLLVELDPGCALTGYVKEEVGGAPVEGVLVGSSDHPYLILSDLDISDEGCVHAITDKEGFFTLKGLVDVKQKIVAIHPEYAQAVKEVKPGDTNKAEILLKSGHHIFGKILDDNGNPVAGVKIGVRGGASRITRKVVSGPGGDYCTYPILPGKVKVYAYTSKDGICFTGEAKVVHLNDKDVEVNFGPSDDSYVTWRGVLLDFEDNPVNYNEILVHRRRDSSERSWSYPEEIKVTSNEDGKFKVCKLTPGNYEVKTVIKSDSCADYVYWSKIDFEHPGLVERDIKVSGSTLEGVVVNSKTGKPVCGKTGEVFAILNELYFPKFNAPVDKKGRFTFRGIPPGYYDLLARFLSTYSYKIKGVHIEESQVKDDIKLMFPTTGLLLLEVTDMTEPGIDRFELHFEYCDGTRPDISRVCVRDDTGFKDSIYLEEGKWNATFIFYNRGIIERTFQIYTDKTTNLVLHGKKLKFFDSSVTVEGRLSWSDKTPLAQTRLWFAGIRIPGKKQWRSKEINTDQDGRFSLDGFIPGTYRVTVLQGSSSIKLPVLKISTAPENPVYIELIVPTGRVTGTFYDNDGEKGFNDNGPEWSIRIQDPEWNPANGGTEFYCTQRGTGGNGFELIGLPTGDYRLRVDLFGYFEYLSKPFHFTEGQNKDVGKIGLQKCGQLRLEVVDKNNSPLRFTLFCNEKEDTYFENQFFNEVWDKLPLGQVKIRISSRGGYKDHKFECILEPGKPLKKKVVMVEE